MHLRTSLAYMALITAAAALTFHWVGGLAAFAAYQTASGNAEVVKIYQTCIERTNSGVVTSTTVECVGRLLGYLVNALGSAAAGGFAVGTAESGFGNVQENNPAGPSKRTSDVEHRLVGTINSHLASQNVGGSQLLVTDVTTSDVHGPDGFAIRLNVHGDATTLAVHTNGTHALAVFEDGVHLGRRDFLPTDNHYYQFTGVNGIKMEAHDINIPHSSDYTSDLANFADRFGRSDLQPKPVFKNSDAWTYEVCNKAKTATFFYGKIVAEQNRPGKNYEDLSPPGC